MKKGRRKKGDKRVASNGYSRINPSIMSSASEFPRRGERLEIIKQSGMPAVVEEGRKRGGGERVGGGRTVRGGGGRREVSALARVIVRGNKI